MKGNEVLSVADTNMRAKTVGILRAITISMIFDMNYQNNSKKLDFFVLLEQVLLVILSETERLGLLD